MSATANKGPSIGGVQFVLGMPKNGGGSEVQSVVFDKANWTAAQARAWLKKWNLKSDEMRETGDSYRFRQTDPGKYASFATEAVRNVHHVMDASIRQAAKR